MDRLVLDTNVIVSAALSARGAPARIVGKALARSTEIAVSPVILAEYEEVLSRPEFGRVAAESSELMRELRACATLVLPAQSIRACSDCDDDKFLECAFAFQADYLITGKLRHLPRKFPGTEILAPAAYLRRRSS